VETKKHQAAAPQSQPPVEMDADGFLIHPKQWSRQVAQMLADLDGIGRLGPDHWAVIYYLREHWESYGAIPPITQACRTQHLGEHAAHKLFGGCREAWRIAGLPNPGEEAKSHM